MKLNYIFWISKGLEVTENFIIVQYYIDSNIDVYDVKTKEFAFRLEGHEYGGQCLKVNIFPFKWFYGWDWEKASFKVSTSSNILYSGSMDFSLKSWNLEKRAMCDSVCDHCDYVESLDVQTG